MPSLQLEACCPWVHPAICCPRGRRLPCTSWFHGGIGKAYKAVQNQHVALRNSQALKFQLPPACCSQQHRWVAQLPEMTRLKDLRFRRCSQHQLLWAMKPRIPTDLCLCQQSPKLGTWLDLRECSSSAKGHVMGMSWTYHRVVSSHHHYIY